MFQTLTQKFHGLFANFGRGKKLTEENITEAVREVRLTLLEADVNYAVASAFVKKVKEKVVGDSLIKSVSPREQFIKIIYDELVSLMGEEESTLHLKTSPAVIMLCGLQGSGKTTHAAKLAHYLKKNRKKVLIAACDLQRRAAIEQLEQLGKKHDLSVFSLPGETKPTKVAKKALEKAKMENFDVLIVDTAGRLHIDEPLMEELEEIKRVTSPHEVLFVANATTGQDAVTTAQEFDKRIQISGSILTMLDGDARAGAAISISEVTKKPLKFEGVGEKIEDLQLFNPKSMADRILGKGDIINLVKKAEDHISEEESKKLEKKLKKATFNYDDYLKQMATISKMGSIKSVMKMIPGVSSAISDFDMPEKELKKIQAIIYSMTQQEREERVELIHSRRKRIALGCGVDVDQVNKMVKGFKRIKQFFKTMPKQGMLSNMKQLGRGLWR